MSDRIHPAAIDATGYVGDGAQALHDDGTWKAPGRGAVYGSTTWNTATDGSDTLTLAAEPIAGTLRLEVNRSAVRPGDDYTLSGQTATFAAPLTAGDEVMDSYLTATADPGPSVLSGGLSLADLPATAYAAHRGGGLLAPEGTMEAFARAVADGADVLELDVWITSDNVLVVTHDGTDLSRTTDGAGTVASKTAAQIAALNIDSGSWFGSSYYGNLHIPTLDEVLDAHAGQVCMFIQAGSAAVYAPLIDEINARGIAASVAVQGETAADLSGVVSAGVPAAVVVQDDAEATGAASPTNLAAAGIGYAVVSGNLASPVSDANVSAYVSAGIKVYMFDVVRQYRRDHYTALGVAGFITDDPKYLKGSGYQLAADPFADQTFWHGHLTAAIVEGADDITATARGSWDGVDAWGVATAGETIISALQGWAEPADPAGSYAIDIDIEYAILGSDSARWAGVKVCATQDVAYNETNSPAIPSGDNGYVALLRQNGTLALYRRDPGATAAVLLGSVATAAVTAGATVPLRIDVAPTTVRVTRGDTGDSLLAADSTYRGRHVYFTRYGFAGIQGPAVWFRNGSMTGAVVTVVDGGTASTTADTTYDGGAASATHDATLDGGTA